MIPIETNLVSSNIRLFDSYAVCLFFTVEAVLQKMVLTH